MPGFRLFIVVPPQLRLPIRYITMYGLSAVLQQYRKEILANFKNDNKLINSKIIIKYKKERIISHNWIQRHTCLINTNSIHTEFGREASTLYDKKNMIIA